MLTLAQTSKNSTGNSQSIAVLPIKNLENSHSLTTSLLTSKLEAGKQRQTTASMASLVHEAISSDNKNVAKE